MLRNPAIRSYQETTVTSVGPERLITLLYEGIFQQLAQVEEGLRTGDIARRARGLNRAQAIVAELKHSLDHAVAPELCARLVALYDYVSGELLQVHLDADPVHLERSRRVLEPLYRAWKAIPSGTAERERARRRQDGPDPAGAGPETAGGGGAPAEASADRSRELCVAV